VTIKKKILIGYGVAFALMSLVIAWAVSNLVSLGRASEAILSENYRSILAAENMVDALERQDSGVLLFLMGDIQTGSNQFRENEAQFFQWFARAKDNITIKAEVELIDSIDTAYSLYRHRFPLLGDEPGTASIAAPDTIYQQSVYPLFASVRELCIRLRHLNEETMYAASVRAREVADRAIWSTSLVAASALVLALIFSLILAERIVGPIRRFMEASRQISEGNYSVQVRAETSDELGRLAGEFNQMATKLDRYHKMNIEQIIAEKSKADAILSSIDDGVIVFDTELKMTSINPAARHLLDLDQAQPGDWQCADIFPKTNICELIRQTIQAGEQPDIPAEQRILSFPASEGSRHYLFSITSIRGRDRSLSGIVLLLRDVTRLREVERLKSEFIMAASHELRTPLTSLGMSVDLLQENAASALDERDRELLKAAHEEVHRMKALVNDLLDLSKIEAGRIELEFEGVQVQSLFEHVSTLFQSQAEMKGVTLTSEPVGNLPDIRADANKITWVLTNLISNALRYTDKGGYVTMTARQVGQHVYIIVHDDGPGVPIEYQSRIFEKFVQVSGQESGGSGLGLAICKEIVRAHGGAIWVESTPGHGSDFTFTLPVIE
jgi:NtrC-family two-component system sensor histidine kinase KinB